MYYSYCLVFSLFVTSLFGQNDQANFYFQQEANFNIDVTLDDTHHVLQGQWEMEYTNHSPDELLFIYIHLWPNAYSERTTAFTRQKLNSGNTDLYFSEDKYLGGIDSLSFTAKGISLQIESTKLGPDVVKLILNKPLQSGQTITINSPFRVKIPGSFSRLGRVGQSYQMTQWYPKPAVYDREGWHPMPYLDAGEFYSEFGNFEVSITLPANYLVGATGQLLDEKERQWLIQKAEKDAQRVWSDEDDVVWEEASFPASDTDNKTLHYKAENVHDFAWFADKRFYVLHDTLQLADDRVIDAWSFFTDREAQLWQKSIEYIKRSTRFYSDKVGDYLYPQVTALQSALSAGAGMEYPMVTVIGLSGNDRDLDKVITHEVGHNWFYGILASNERDHAWMDEGFNSYYEHRYMQEYYGDENTLDAPFKQDEHSDLNQLGYRYFACRHMLKAPDTPSEDFLLYNYWLGAYSIPSMALQQLEDQIGKDKVDMAMQSYFQKWQFMHPQAADAQKALVDVVGDPLEWLFQDFLMSSKTQDYSIQSVKKKEGKSILNLKNKGEVPGPFSLMTEGEDGQVDVHKIDGFVGEKSIPLADDDYQSISVDPHHNSLELNRQNNYWHKGWGRFEPPKLKLISFKKDENYSNVFLLPLAGFNQDDGVMAGVVAYNRTLLPSPFEFALAPLYGVKSKKIRGVGAARYRWWPANDKIQEISLIANFRQFSFRTYDAENLPLAYQRFSPSLRFSLVRKKHWDRAFQFRSIWLNEQQLSFNDKGVFEGTFKRDRQINEFAFLAKRKWVLAPVSFKIAVEQSNYTDDFSREQDYIKLRVEARGKILYEKESAFHWRLFAGSFLSNSLENSTYSPATSFSLFDHGAADYRYDNLYFGRTAIDGFAGRQLANRAGGFRAPVAANFGIGRSNKNMFSVNASVDVPFLPKWLPVKPYLDAASFFQEGFDGGSNQFLWNGGLAMEWLDGKVGLYLPLGGSDEIMDRLKEQGGWAERLSFRVSLRDLSPWNWMDSLESL